MSQRFWMYIRHRTVRTSEFKIGVGFLYVYVALVMFLHEILGGAGIAAGMALALFIHAEKNDMDDPTFEGTRPLGASNQAYEVMLPFNSYRVALLIRMLRIVLYHMSVVPLYLLTLYGTTHSVLIEYLIGFSEGQVRLFVGFFSGCFFLTIAHNYLVTAILNTVKDTAKSIVGILKGK